MTQGSPTPSGSSHPSSWFVELNGTLTGPWSLEQLKELLKEGTILPSHLVYSSATTDGSATMIGELLSDIQSLPPRPNEIISTDTDTPLQRKDPILDLFDALQYSRDRKVMQKPMTEISERGSPLGRHFLKKIPGKFWFILFISLALGGVIWSSYSLLQKSSQMTKAASNTAQSQPAPSTQDNPPPETKPQTAAATTPSSPILPKTPKTPLNLPKKGVTIKKPDREATQESSHLVMPQKSEAELEQERTQREIDKRELKEQIERAEERERLREIERERELQRQQWREDNGASNPPQNPAAPPNPGPETTNPQAAPPPEGERPQDPPPPQP